MPCESAIIGGLFMNPNPHVAVVGATGAVGIEMIKTLEKRSFPVGQLTLLASARSVGKKLKFRGQDVTVKELTKDSFVGIDIALFSAGGGISREYAPLAAKAAPLQITSPMMLCEAPETSSWSVRPTGITDGRYSTRLAKK